jgi:hypothetical protein
MAFGIFMMDNPDNSVYKMDQRKKISISKIDKILKVSGMYHPSPSFLINMCGFF